MKRITDEIGPMFHKLLEKGQDWLSRLVNATDHTITKLIDLFEEKKDQFQKYIVDRKQLINEIETKQTKIATLQVELNKINEQQKEKVIQLYEELHNKSNDIIHMQQEYFDLQKSIESSTETINLLHNEKEAAIRERDWLRSEYESLQKILSDNTSELEIIHKELEQLKQEQTKIDKDTVSSQNNLIQVEIDKKSEQRNKLIYENKKHNDQIAEIERQLLNKVKEITRLSGELQQAEQDLQRKEEKIHHLQIKLTQKNKEIKEQQKEYEQLKFQMKETSKELYEKKQFLQLYEAEIKDLEYQLEQKDEIHFQEVNQLLFFIYVQS